MDLEFIKGQFTEDPLEQAIISLFEEQGYTHVRGGNIHRQFDEILLEDDLRAFLSSRYADLTENETAKIISRLQNIPSAPSVL